MKTIKLKEAYDILNECSGVIIEDSVILYPQLADLDGDDENEFLFLFWDDDGAEYNMKFCEGDNREITISGSSMFLYDTDCEKPEGVTQISILEPKNLES